MKKQKADLLQGTLELLVLRLLRFGRFNGWDIMQRLQLVSGCALSSPSSSGRARTDFCRMGIVREQPQSQVL